MVYRISKQTETKKYLTYKEKTDSQKRGYSFDRASAPKENFQFTPIAFNAPNEKFDYNRLIPKKVVNSDKFSQQSLGIIDNMAKRLNFNSEDLKASILLESGGNPQAENQIGAVGLIQMTKTTAEYMGTSVEKLKTMSAEEQLVYVEKYLERAKKIAGITPDEKIDRATLYALIFCPARAKQDVLYKKGYDSYKLNSSYDKNTDGIITKQEASSCLDKFYTYTSVLA